jgi:hypothetical protein
MKLCQAVRISEEVQTLCKRATTLRDTYIACLVVHAGPFRGVLALTNRAGRVILYKEVTFVITVYVQVWCNCYILDLTLEGTLFQSWPFYRLSN